MVVRPVVLQDPPRHPFPAQLPFNNCSRSISPLDATLTQLLILRHLKSFRMSTYTKTSGRALLQASRFVNSLRPSTTPRTHHICHRHFACKPFSINRLRTLSITNRGGGSHHRHLFEFYFNSHLPRSSSFDFQPSTLKLFLPSSAPLRYPSPPFSRPPTAYKPSTTDTFNPPASPFLSCASARFPSPWGRVEPVWEANANT